MKAIMVCVDYSDLLVYTLPYNRHHFEEVWVVTSPGDEATHKLLGDQSSLDTTVYMTNAFYRNGALFNKWLALEEGLNVMGRRDWICIMDPDVLWPKQLPDFPLVKGKLYAPLRRMCLDLSVLRQGVPPEDTWKAYPLHRQQHEFAGFSQIFHGDDPVLGKPPWHETDWRHAGGADSFFQQKWPPADKIRPPFEVLHLGPAGTNWGGRVTPYVDGSIDPKAQSRYQELSSMIAKRAYGPPSERFRAEKLS